MNMRGQYYAKKPADQSGEEKLLPLRILWGGRSGLPNPN